MELNTKGRYAVMALADLAKHGGDDALALSTIADRQRISLPYLEQLFLKLRKAGLVDSSRGRLGGYRLARAAGDIDIASILEAVDEPVEMTRCGGHAASPCLGTERCLTHDLWQVLGDRIRGYLSGVTLKDVLDGKLNEGKRAAVRENAA